MVLISASRRTDIPAFFSPWFIQRIEKGYCKVANPFNPNQIRKVSLLPQDVEGIVFWTKNPGPIFSYLPFLNQKGYHYIFQFTLTPYGSLLEPEVPSLENRIKLMQKLGERLGTERVIWRFDPLIFTEEMDFDFFARMFSILLDRLNPFISRIITSRFSPYRSAKNRLKKRGIELLPLDKHSHEFEELIWFMQKQAELKGLKLESCADKGLQELGVCSSGCINGDYWRGVTGNGQYPKDSGQRGDCKCVKSVDIGAYGTCPHLCLYCYGYRGRKQVEQNFKAHNPESVALGG